MRRKNYWIQGAMSKHKKGSLSHQLEIPIKENIPFTLLERIRVSPIGTTIRNPSKSGKRRIRVTRLVKQRAVLALNLKRIRRK
jgi:hypothetical protein